MAEIIATLAIQLGFLILLARVFGAAAARIRVPAVMGELVAGIVFGPYALGGLPLPGFPAGLFPMCHATPGIPLDPLLYAVATLGSIALLFQSGLETDVRTFFRYSVAGTMVGIGGIVCSFICGAAVGRFVLGWPLMDPRTLFLGILCTATSVGISARILSEHHAMGSPEGVTIMAAAVIDDVLGIVCLAVVVGIAGVGLGLDCAHHRPQLRHLARRHRARTRLFAPAGGHAQALPRPGRLPDARVRLRPDAGGLL